LWFIGVLKLINLGLSFFVPYQLCSHKQALGSLYALYYLMIGHEFFNGSNPF